MTNKMLGWVDDVPKNSKKVFLKILKEINPKHILEVGSYEGRSLVEMLKLFPLAHASAVDWWVNSTENYVLNQLENDNVEQTFRQNIAPYKHRVSTFKGPSQYTLPKLLKLGYTYDFIYVDASHRAFDAYSDMVFCWSMLREGGVMAVDDVLYTIKTIGNVSNPSKEFYTPRVAVEHFLDAHDRDALLYNSGYRVFIKKCSVKEPNNQIYLPYMTLKEFTKEEAEICK